MTLVDTHCHLDFDSYDADRADILARAAEARVAAIINPGIDLPTSGAACDLAAAHEAVYAAVGVHPNSTAGFAEPALEGVRALAGRSKVVAIGEIGLDYYRDRSPRETQWRAFEAQLTLAAELGLPVIIHNREASVDTLRILESWLAGLQDMLRQRPGVLHSFSVPAALLEPALATGFYVGITGPVTYKKAEELRRIVAAVPVERLLVETDGPFLTPHPYRGERNEPAYVRFVADRIAAVRQTTPEAVAAQTTANAARLFALPL